MAKARKIFTCRSCGSVQNKWMGKCPDCGSWDSLEDELVDAAAKKDPQRGLVAAWADIAEGETDLAPPDARGARAIGEILSSDPAGETGNRFSSGIGEFDRVLGGVGTDRLGLVPGSAVLIGGEPGIGKSTLLLQAARAWAASGHRTLYVSSEESAEQVTMRAARLSASGDGAEAVRPKSNGVAAGNAGGDAASNLFILADTNLARIVEQARRVKPAVMVIDSVQMVYKADLDAGPGSITQLRRCCAELVYLAKLSGIAVVLVGHVTKDGRLAGPRLLEHLVDAVLSFEGDRYHAHRVVRAVKNRFGTTLEIGLFEMTGHGLKPVPGGAKVAMDGPARPGAVICPVLTGSRCYLIEVQALTATGFLGAAKRKSSGLDPNRLAMLIAVLEQHAGIRLADRDVFASSVGGVRVVEPAADLALLLAIAGAERRKPLPGATAVIGEVGLGGEVRPVTQIEQRIREAARLGCTRVILPKAQSGVQPGGGGAEPRVQISAVRTVAEAIEHLG